MITTLVVSALLLLGRAETLQIQQTPRLQTVLKDDTHPIDADVYNNLFTYAHLMDIAYCVTEVGRISEPFKCHSDCEDFHNMTLKHQWYSENCVSGYIATTEANLFNYSTPKKTIIVSLRGTRSIFDTFADMKMDFLDYHNMNVKLPECIDCKVHRGFYRFFTNTLTEIHSVLESELRQPDTELVIVGHSLGGSIALLLGLHYLDLGFNQLTVVTMGQPLVGNREFVRWTDKVMGSRKPVRHNDFGRKYFRVIHKADVVTIIPQSNGMFQKYYQFDNQIYVNTSSHDSHPGIEAVVDCIPDDPSCIAGDFPAERLLQNNYLEIHNTYFRKMGLCYADLWKKELPNEVR